MKKMKKNSYLNMVLPGTEKRYDMNTWYECEKKVASYVDEGYSFDQSVKYASKPYMSSDQEIYDFYHWARNRMNYKKASLEKEALYYTPINLSEQSNWKKEDLPEKTFEAKEKYQESNKNDDAAYKKLRRYIIGLTRVLLESDKISEEDYENAHKYLGALTRIFKGSFSNKVKADYTHNTANKILKLSNNTIGGELKKFAQELDQQVQSEQAQPAAQQQEPQQQAQPTQQAEAPAEEPQSAQPGQSGQQNVSEQSGIDIPLNEDVKPVRFEDIKAPEHDPERYDDLAGDINVGDAATKLDEIAGMLADRRVIRLLAEFDIMLDRLGVASMFPELAESQSKLIDAFSYALTRVTKMMGQLANAQQVIQSTTENIEERGQGAPLQPQEGQDQQ